MPIEKKHDFFRLAAQNRGKNKDLYIEIDPTAIEDKFPAIVLKGGKWYEDGKEVTHKILYSPDPTIPDITNEEMLEKCNTKYEKTFKTWLEHWQGKGHKAKAREAKAKRKIQKGSKRSEETKQKMRDAWARRKQQKESEDAQE